MIRQQGEGEGFNSVLKRSIQQGIASVVGRETAISVEFYLDPIIATKDIVRYNVALDKMFKAGAKLIQERCARALFSNLQLDFKHRDDYDLSAYVTEAKRRWLLGESARKQI